MAQTDLSRPLLGVRPATGDAERPLSAGRRALLTALITLAAFTIAETVTVYTDPFTGIALHAITMSALLVASGFGSRVDREAEHPLSRLLLALALVPLIRIVSLTMPLGRFGEETYWFLAAGAPVFVAATVILTTLGLRPSDVGLRFSRQGPHLQLGVILFGFVLGFAEYHILRPDPLIDDLTLRSFVAPALILIFATGFLEEFIFRGILQRTAASAFGAPAILYASLIFAILHIGYRSAADVAFVFVIALLYGWVVQRTGSIIGVSVSHGITNITLFLLMPFVSVLAAQPDWLPPLK